MRNTFAKVLTELAAKDDSIYVLTADLGFPVFKDFENKFPARYVNCGIAEQNMIGMAVGLALSGKRVFVYSIIPFVTMRCFEQIRNGICGHNLDVIIVGVGSGYSFGHLGQTHHAIEDVAIMRSLPNMKVLCPADPVETELIVRSIADNKGPFYLRLVRNEAENIHKEPFDFKIGKAVILKKGTDITLIGSGSILKNALAAANALEAEKNLSVRVISMPTLKPLDEEIVLLAARETAGILTVEEHNVIGGLGDAVASVIAGSPFGISFKKIGIDDRYVEVAGDPEYLAAGSGLSPEGIEKAVWQLWKSKNHDKITVQKGKF